MEIKNVNLLSQIHFLGGLVKNAEYIEIQNSSDNNISNINHTIKQLSYYYFSYDNQIENKLDIYEISLNLKNSINEQKLIFELKYKEDIGNKNIKLITATNLNNKIYILFRSNDLSHVYGGIYDLEENKYFPIILETEENKNKIKEIINQIPLKDYITILEQNIIFFFGGIKKGDRIYNEENEVKIKSDYIIENETINKSCIYFNIEQLEFGKQKFQEFSLIPRYKLGGTNQNGIIYLIGGYTSLSNIEENICNYVQYANISILNYINLVWLNMKVKILKI